ncbi:superoxide dismutase [Marinomonas primoryensis]|jgi:Fe-Mn family superoxide dismutase|uniref:Superoxide dismutase n=1 Tax=Marinomonas primoryensis TaxID=178399 RepID=A0A2Z4PT81_9GAMM|nr:Fe-Mn family superoxide dismutase [Marinomonas primoryensis]AWY00788.1 superoxide dismutase [Marinomonas primoryensis]QKK80687.1 superoxide dismutase [Marinomonas primoryensis]
MSFELPALPYAKDALEPHMSVETLEYHYGKHHNTYVVKLNGLVPGSEYENKTLEEIITSAPAGPVFNNAAQIWNHTFFWNSLSPNGGGEPTGALADAINAKWGSFAEFQTAFNDKAVNNFGSSWTWLVKNTDGSVEIVNTSNAGTPMTSGQTAVITVDLWEHAYYIDYRNVRPDYLKGFWALANWEFAAANFAG